MPRCKVGDRAFIVRAPNCPANIGKIVLILAPATIGDTRIDEQGTTRTLKKTSGYYSWLVQSLSGPLDVCAANGEKPYGKTMRRWCADPHLLPIRDLDEDAQTTRGELSPTKETA